MKTRTRVSQAQAYAESFASLHGDPRARVRRIAAEYRVQPQSVLNALRRYWGPRRFREEIPALPRGPKAGPRSPEAYARRFQALSGTAEERLRIITRSFRVQRATVQAMLRKAWGRGRYRLKFGRSKWAGVPELLRRLNANLGEPGGPVLAVASELGIKPASLRSRLSRLGIRRGPKGYQAKSR